jgi:histidyl-tRNA synthetase
MKPIRGTKDLVGYEYVLYSNLIDKFHTHMLSYGFSGIEPSILESKDLYSVTVGSTSDIVLKEMFIVDSMSSICETEKFNLDTVLRPEGTISCLRALINSGKIQERNLKVFYSGPMFRYNRPQRGRLRQFTQLGCEVLNEDNFLVDAEVIECLWSFLKSIKIDCQIHINSIGTTHSLDRYRPEITKFFEANIDHLSAQNKTRLSSNPLRVLDQLTEEEKNNLPPIPNIINFLSKDERLRFENLCSTLNYLNIPFTIDPYLVRGLDYYQNTVFEIMRDGQSICGGGCYRIIRFDIKRDIIGLGWAIGLERIADLATLSLQENDLHLIAAIDGPYGLKVSRILREHQKRTQIIFGDIQDCLRRAQFLNPAYVLFCGRDEECSNTVKIKDWQNRNEIILNLDEIPGFF